MKRNDALKPGAMKMRPMGYVFGVTGVGSSEQEEKRRGRRFYGSRESSSPLANADRAAYVEAMSSSLFGSAAPGKKSRGRDAASK
ncbi:MAG TPA: hypothetical protein VFC78_17295 [Tepidisphaeraceae bacterium]|nr:hypothetical protein [Tepidisphaeraceae bacterium]